LPCAPCPDRRCDHTTTESRFIEPVRDEDTPIHALFNHPVLRKVLLESRAILCLLAMAAVIHWLYPPWLWVGATVAISGELLQMWCFACLRKDSMLCTNGPYAFCRNPMYLGRFVMMLGIILLLGKPMIAGGFVVVYAYYVVNRVAREEAKLRECLGEPYAEYCRQVNRFMPSLRPFATSKVWFFDAARFKKNCALTNGLLVLAFFVAAWWLTGTSFNVYSVA
jgi:protein-S-isoprenylcysteine O-methyltransferase Ste14